MASQFNLLASIAAGRAVSVYWHSNPKFSAYTDNRHIYLPHPEVAPSFVSEYGLAVITQGLLIRGGSLRRKFIKHLIGKKVAGRQYVFAEAARLRREFGLILPTYYVDHLSFQAFENRTLTSKGSLQWALDVQSVDIPLFVGTPRLLTAALSGYQETAGAELTNEQKQGVIETEEMDEHGDDEAEDAEVSKAMRLFENPLVGSGFLTDRLREIMGAARTGDLEDEAQPANNLAIGGVVQSQARGVFATLTDFVFDMVLPERPYAGAYYYAEWDDRIGVYKSDWVCVEEVDPWREEPISEEALNRLLVKPPHELLRYLSGIGMSMQRHKGEMDGEELYLENLIDRQIDCALGMSPTERVYSALRRTRRDLSVLILLDASGSTQELGVDGESLLHKHIRFGYQLAYALEMLGDRVSLYGFHSWGRKLVRLLRIKSFRETKLAKPAFARLENIESLGYTRMGAAIRHGAMKLQTEAGTPYQLLLIISDGFSYDQDYEGRYGEQDTRKALEEVRNTGVGCLCLSIGSSQNHEKLEEVFGVASTLSAPDEAECLHRIRPAVLGALGMMARQ